MRLFFLVFEILLFGTLGSLEAKGFQLRKRFTVIRQTFCLSLGDLTCQIKWGSKYAHLQIKKHHGIYHIRSYSRRRDIYQAKNRLYAPSLCINPDLGAFSGSKAYSVSFREH